MDFQILGPLEVRREGTQVALGAAKQRALLAILLVRANEPVSSDRLIEELWPEPPETAANTLQVYVGKLRKALEPERTPGSPGELLLTRAPGYMLRVEPDELDADRFERLLSEGRAAHEARDHANAARHASPGARAVAGPCAGGLRLRPVRSGGDRPLGRAATRRHRGADRGGARPGQSRGPGGGARGPDQGQPAARAPARTADARALSLRASGGCPGGLPADPRDPRRGARPRPEPTASASAGSDPPPGAGARSLDRNAAPSTRRWRLPSPGR